jgi:hypothetical protein
MEERVARLRVDKLQVGGVELRSRKFSQKQTRFL